MGFVRTCSGLESYLDSGMMPILRLPATIYLPHTQSSLQHGSTAVSCFVLITK